MPPLDEMKAAQIEDTLHQLSGQMDNWMQHDVARLIAARNAFGLGVLAKKKHAG